MQAKDPSSRVVSFRLPKERAALLMRIAKRRGMTRTEFVRAEIEDLLVACPEEQLTPLEEAAIKQREFDAYASRRVTEIRDRVT